MGGHGSGRIGEKTLTFQMMALDVRSMHRQRFIKKALQLPSGLKLEASNESGSIRVRFNAEQLSIKYFDNRYSGVREPVCIIVKFDWTPCHFGGHRPWFLCPKCGRRVAILYGGKYFRCRICWNLAYPSENEPQWSRMLLKANKIKKRLHCKPGIQNRPMFKPKGMHQKTFDRLRFQVHLLENMAVKQLSEKININ